MTQVKRSDFVEVNSLAALAPCDLKPSGAAFLGETSAVDAKFAIRSDKKNMGLLPAASPLIPILHLRPIILLTLKSDSYELVTLRQTRNESSNR